MGGRGSAADRAQVLKTGQYTARDADDEVTATQLLANGGPEVKAAAQVALDGPASWRREFVQVGRFQAAQRDADASTHDAAMRSLLAQISATAAIATQQAAKAAEAAATARKAADDANRYAAEARASANDADRYATEARNSANAAQTSADQAAASAKTAREAAARARQDAAAAGVSANRAAGSASQARAYASAAYGYAARARRPAVRGARRLEHPRLRGEDTP